MDLEIIAIVLVIVNVLITLFKSSSNEHITVKIQGALYTLIILFEVVITIENIIFEGPWFLNLLFIFVLMTQALDVYEEMKKYKKPRKSKRAKDKMIEADKSHIVV